MIIKLKGANFSANNINALLNSYFVSITGGSCVTAASSISSVSKDSPIYSNTFTVNTDYSVSNVEVTMGGSVVSGAANVTTGEAGTVITIAVPTVTGNLSIKFTYTYNGVEEPDNPGSGDVVDPGEGDGNTEYISYIGSDTFNATGVRVQAAENDLGWAETTSGSTSAATDYIPVSSVDSIWIEHIAVVNNGLASGGFYDMNQNLVAPLYWGTFGIDQAANASAKFVTPENPVTIASVEEEWNCTIAYVRFIAWSAGDGNNTGIETTEARVYYANGVPQEPTYTSYIGEDAFSFNKESFTNTGYTTSGSSSAYATDYLPVTPEQGVWLQYIFTMSDAHRCVGFFDSNKTFIKSLTAADFGLSTSGKFQTPNIPVKINSIDGTENVAYVRFVAWDTSDGGRANTEARIYTY